MAFSNSSVCLVHGMSRPIGAHFHVPHGLSNALLLPDVTHGPKSVKGSEYLACIWSVVETCRQQGRSVWDFLTVCLAAAAEGRIMPTLLPLPNTAHAA
jgi:alcohol dehydrogenase class IV